MTTEMRVGEAQEREDLAHRLQQEKERIHQPEFDIARSDDSASGKWEQIDRLAAIGWPQFPCFGVTADGCSCGKNDPNSEDQCEAKGKHPIPRHGVKEATTARDQLWAWHCQLPDANWALATGAPSGLVVIDLDPAKGGFESWDDYEMNRRGADFPVTTQVRTGGQGRHLILSYPAGRRVRNRVNWLPGVDVRGDGGYVILPGSRHISGGGYEWLNPGVPVAEAPDDLLEAINARGPSRPGAGSGSGSGTLTTPTQELRERGFRHGERDNGLNALAWRLVRSHYPHRDLIEGILREVYQASDQVPPLAWSKVEDQLDRAWAALEPQIIAERRWAEGLRSKP